MDQNESIEENLNKRRGKFNWRKADFTKSDFKKSENKEVCEKYKISFGSNPKKNFLKEIPISIQIFGEDKKSRKRKLKITPVQRKKITYDIPEGPDECFFLISNSSKN